MVGIWWARWRRLQSGLQSEWVNEGLSGGAPRWLAFVIQVFHEFWRNRCQVRAAGLAYTTLLALVPLLAVSISVASVLFDVKEPGNQERLGKGLEDLVNYVAPALGLEDANGNARRREVANGILAYVSNINFTTIGVTAAAGLIFVAISLLRTIESAFNDIWGQSEGRGWFQSIVLYWAAITLGPLLFVVVKSLSYVRAFGAASSWFQAGFGQVLLQLSAFLPLVLLTLTFSSLYRLMPNTRVQWRAALFGGVVAAGLWWLNNQAATLYNSKVVLYSKVYGSLGILPLFLAGLYLSWLILLLGAQTAYVFQYRDRCMDDRRADHVDGAGRELAAVRIMLEIGRAFASGHPAPDLGSLAGQLGIPVRLAARLIASLRLQGLVHEITPPPRTLGGRLRSGSDEPRYAPAQPLTDISLAEVWQAVRGKPGGNLPVPTNPTAQLASAAITEMITAAERQGRTARLSDLIARMPGAA